MSSVRNFHSGRFHSPASNTISSTSSKRLELLVSSSLRLPNELNVAGTFWHPYLKMECNRLITLYSSNHIDDVNSKTIRYLPPVCNWSWEWWISRIDLLICLDNKIELNTNFLSWLKWFKFRSRTKTNTYWECSVIESIVFIAFEEICVAICVLECSINIIGHTFPVRQ